MNCSSVESQALLLKHTPNFRTKIHQRLIIFDRLAVYTYTRIISLSGFPTYRSSMETRPGPRRYSRALTRTGRGGPCSSVGEVVVLVPAQEHGDAAPEDVEPRPLLLQHRVAPPPEPRAASAVLPLPPRELLR
ncbi:hypothetical protein C2845_PM06G05530 [Panicum miliaceum]|uniref:Uncharacterized protein n=1 Tax=Panicum miliaceum TaxID=4540 RepID=A0A3L6R6S5_PANMI|nr:hypothetical protein C2845_PM06G05530 [Panicum miliaceum]